MARILVVDDEPAARHAAVRALSRGVGGPHDVVECEDGRAALAAVADEPADLVLLDLRMPGLDGNETLRRLMEMPRPPAVIVITADATLRSAIDAVKAGATDFLAKPYGIDELRHVVEKTLSSARLGAENRRLKAEVARLSGTLLGESPAMREVLDLVARVAPASASVLVTGETGTGKELVARRIHELSAVSSGPFVAVNCAAIPETLVESELFGHRRGAFTGADRDRTGRVPEADGGTLFLDEIGDMPFAVQSKLLRVLADGVVEPVGGGKPRTVKVRVISATHRDLPALVAAGRFREDLLYRLRVVDLALPPLRERADDAVLLARRFLEEQGRGPLALARDAEDAIRAHRWPGNVRELRNAMERAALFCRDGVVSAGDLPIDVRGARRGGGTAQQTAAWDPALDFATQKERASEAFERSVLSAALEAHGGNVSAAARALGLHRPNLQQKLKDLGIVPATYRGGRSPLI